MREFITLLLYLAAAFAISCSRKHGQHLGENQLPILTPEAASTSTKPDSPVTIQGATFGRSRHEVVVSFTDRKQYNPEDLLIHVQFFTQTPNGLAPITQVAKSDMTSWDSNVAKNQTHKLRISEVGDFARMTVDVHISDMATVNEEHVASKSFDVSIPQ